MKFLVADLVVGVVPLVAEAAGVVEGVAEEVEAVWAALGCMFVVGRPLWLIIEPCDSDRPAQSLRKDQKIQVTLERIEGIASTIIHITKLQQSRPKIEGRILDSNGVSLTTSSKV